MSAVTPASFASSCNPEDRSSHLRRPIHVYIAQCSCDDRTQDWNTKTSRMGRQLNTTSTSFASSVTLVSVGDIQLDCVRLEVETVGKLVRRLEVQIRPLLPIQLHQNVECSTPPRPIMPAPISKTFTYPPARSSVHLDRSFSPYVTDDAVARFALTA